jgi:alpha-L-rhamnosidase
VQVVTDKTWKTHPSPTTLLGVWDFMHYGGELYDANREIPNWSRPDLDASTWKPARVFHPHLELSAQMVEPNRLVSLLQPVAVEPLGKDVYRVDMGRNFAGWVEVDVRGRPGTRIDLEFSERKEEAMTHRLHSAYILGPAGKGTFRNHFNYSVGRWITIRGLDHPPRPAEVRGYLVRTGYERAGHFACSNPLLNRIYETTLWTFENLSLGGYVVDCPHRERMGYGGDAHATILAGLANYHLGALYTKWAQDWRDVQEKDGDLPYTAPTYWGGGGPAWCGFCITMPWEVYERYGDRRLLEDNFPTMQAWLRFLETKSNKDLLVRWGGEWDFLGDWLWPGADGVNGDTRETLFFNNCYWIYNLETAARVADVLSQHDAAAGYRRRAEQVRRAVHQAFYNPKDASYVNGMQAYLALALLVDLPPAKDRPAVWKRLEQEILVHRQGHIGAGITGGAMLFRALQRADRPDLVLPMALKEDYPGWGDMLRQGATTFWESWEGKLSLLHSSYLYIGGWFHEGLAGIRPSPAAPGFQHFIIKPGVFARDSVDWVRGSYDSLYGEIRSDWQWKDGKLRLEVVVPVNTTATVYVPATDPSAVTEGGQPLKQAEGVKQVGTDKGFVRVEVGSGKYTFVSPEPAVAP